jgi:antitoxin (DNA-binding transcriptional repressor) of toxin-antitoxin stability system
MGHMKKTTVRELHEHTGALVGEAAEGRVIVIHKRGVPVAELRPFQGRPRRKGWLDREDFLARFPQVPGDSSRILEQDRS